MERPESVSAAPYRINKKSAKRHCGALLRVGDTTLVCGLWPHRLGRRRHEQWEPWGRYRWDRQGNVSVVFTTNNGGLEAAERKRRRIYRPKPDRRGR